MVRVATITSNKGTRPISFYKPEKSTAYSLFVMASSYPSAASIKGMLFEGVQSSVPLDIADSKIPSAGSGLFVRRQVPAGTEMFRETLPVVSAVYVLCLIDLCMRSRLVQ